MCKVKVAICDTCDSYRERFVTYLVEHKAGEIKVQAFSAVDLFLEGLLQNKPDIVILGMGFEAAIESLRTERIPCVLLKESMPLQVAEDTDYGTENDIREKEVFRYQPMEAILHEIRMLPRETQIPEEGRRGQARRMETIGVCSPIRHEMQLPFSLALSASLAERKKVLYLNLLAYSGFFRLLGLPNQSDLGDIILRLRGQRLTPELFWKSVYEIDGIFYISPFSNSQNLRELTFEDFLQLIDFIALRTDFEVVVLDFGESLMACKEMLESCSSIYCLTKMGFFFECQMEGFLNYMEWEGDERQSQVHLIELPFSAKHIRGGSGVIRQLLWSEFGDYVRKILAGGIYEN